MAVTSYLVARFLGNNERRKASNMRNAPPPVVLLLLVVLVNNGGVVGISPVDVAVVGRVVTCPEAREAASVVESSTATVVKPQVKETDAVLVLDVSKCVTDNDAKWVVVRDTVRAVDVIDAVAAS
jgi:hypothetical protein